MNHDVFIYCSEKDRLCAEAVCHRLESDGLRCWYVLRDLAPGEEPIETIVRRIAESKVLVYILSEHTCDDPEILSQINTAVSNRVEIVTLRVSDVQISPKLKYYMADAHWLDAFAQPMGAQLDQVCAWVSACVKRAKRPPAARKIPRRWLRAARILAVCAAIACLAALAPTVYRVIRQRPRFRNLLTENAYLNPSFFSADASYYASPDGSGNVGIVGIESGETVQTLKTGYAGEKLTITWSDDDREVWVIGVSGLTEFDLASGAELGRQSFAAPELKDATILACDEVNIYFGFIADATGRLARLIRYDIRAGGIADELDFDGAFCFNGMTADFCFLILVDEKTEVCLLNARDFAQPMKRGVGAYRLCIGNVAPVNPSFTPKGRYWLQIRKPYVCNLRVIDCESGEVVYTFNCETLIKPMFLDEGTIIACVSGVCQLIDFKTGETRPLFSQSLLDAHEEMKDRVLFDVAPCADMGYVFAALQDEEATAVRLCIIDPGEDALLMALDLPTAAESVTPWTFGDKLLILYVSNGTVSLDWTRYDEGRKVKFDYVTR